MSERMFALFTLKWMMLVVLLSLSCPRLLTAWQGIPIDKQKDELDPNVRDWGDYSDLPTGLEHGLGLKEDLEREEYNRGVGESSLNVARRLDFLSEFAGKKRLWVITAPSHNDHYLRMMEKQLEDMDQKGLNCKLAERDTFIITIIQNARLEGRIQKTTFQGDATVESLDPDTVTKLLHYLELTSQEQTFTMMVIKKNLQISEHFPYPVRVEAVLELIDQFPVRKLEKITRQGANLRCKTKKKKVVLKRKKSIKKIVLSQQREGNVTLVMGPSRKHLDKKTALLNKIQDILNGRSRFVIRKVAAGFISGKTVKNYDKESSKVSKSKPGSNAKRRHEEERTMPAVNEGKNAKKEQHTKDKEESNVQIETQMKEGIKKKGKGKKGKKGKGRGKKSNKELSEDEKKILEMFMENLKGSRRLMLISAPSRDATLFMQQTAENEKHHCELAKRKISVATIVGKGKDATLTLQHHQLESEPALGDKLELVLDSDLIPVLRMEFSLSSSDLFSMTVTDYDLKPKRVFEAPLTSLALFEYIDSFPLRHSEKEKEKKSPLLCSKNMQRPVADNSLLRFMSKRRLLLISAPTEEDYSFQQQLSALRGQECQLGVRHFAILKLTGKGEKASGTVELFPINGRSQSELEALSQDVVINLRDQLKISKDYFSMLVVGKDGDVKAWFPSPMWSLVNIYDLVDSMELRMEEVKLQRSVGIHCPEDEEEKGSEPGHYPV